MPNDEKDRLGDKLKDRERAQEDSYFAEQERKLIAKLRAKAAVSRCPRCGVELLAAAGADCPTCA